MIPPADQRALAGAAGNAAGGWLPASTWDMLRDLVRKHQVAEFVVAGEPISKARARFTDAGGRVKVYTPEATKQAEAMIQAAFRSTHPHWKMDGRATFGVFTEFHAATFRRRDVDNMVKLVLDACNGVVWEDDAQVADVLARVERGGTDPRTFVIIYRAAPNGDRPERRARGPRAPASVNRRERLDTSGARVSTSKENQQRLRRTFAFIATSLMAGKDPTLHDIGRHVGLRSLESVRDMVQQLESLGCLAREKKKPSRFKILRPLNRSSPNTEFMEKK